MCTGVVYVCLHVGCVQACMWKLDFGASENQHLPVPSVRVLPHTLSQVTDMCCLPGIYIISGDPISGPHAYTASTLPNKTSIPLALYLFFNCLFEIGFPYLVPNLQSVLSLLPILWHYRLAPSHPSYIRVL